MRSHRHRSIVLAAPVVLLLVIVLAVPAGSQPGTGGAPAGKPYASPPVVASPPAVASYAPPAVASSSRPDGSPRAAAAPRHSPRPRAEGSQDDPAYPSYREAYALILGERWEEARKKFREMIKKYPGSEYRDDAEYWLAYSWRETDSRKAMDAYRNFLRNYRNSSYFDDALADLDQLMAGSMAVPVPDVSFATPPTVVPVPDATVSTPAPAVVPFPDDSGLAFVLRSIPSPAIAPMMKMRHLEWLLQGGIASPRPDRMYRRADVDEGTRLRLETLYAIASSGEDEKGFTTLRKIAVDPGESKVVRAAAVEALSEYRRHDALPVFVEIARNDTSEEMQLFAIDYIGNVARDKEKAFEALRTIYASIPPAKTEKRKMVFYSIAEIGSEKAIDFLADVARSRDDYELRRDAVYYLGTIGGERARTVLIDLLGGK